MTRIDQPAPRRRLRIVMAAIAIGFGRLSPVAPARTLTAASRNRDPSVVGRLELPSVLAMMGYELDLMQELGDAFPG